MALSLGKVDKETDNEVVVQLLPLESSWLLMEEDGIASVTFYRGSIDEATRRIRLRARALVDVNPWLVGRLVRKRGDKKVKLVYPKLPVSDDRFEQLFHPDPGSIRMGSDMQYELLCKEAESAIVSKGHKLLNKPDVVTRITLVENRDDPEPGFALILSISHIPADGYTYYQILNALMSDDAVQPLDPMRNLAAATKIAKVVGKKEYDYIFSFPFAFNALKGMLLGKQAKCYAFYVDPAAVGEIKEQAKRKQTDGPGYVSTNDILTSSFTRAVKSRLCMSAINLRGRVDGIDKSKAGNYEAALLYDNDQSSSALSIRDVLHAGPPFQPTSRPLPSIWEGLTCTMSLITNWATFTGDLGLTGFEQRLHLPLHQIKKTPFDCAIIFAPMPNRLAVMYFAKKVSKESLLKIRELGDPVSEQMFG